MQFIPLGLLTLPAALLSSVIAYPTEHQWAHHGDDQHYSPQNANYSDSWTKLPSGSVEKGQHLMGWINQTYHHNTHQALAVANGTCSSENIVRRREWDDLSDDERREYISAIHCLHSLPAKTNSSFAPGARTRWDDFVVSHIINTKDIHFSGLLLPWHRQFVWMFENALRDECGYRGYQPYWDWSKHAFKPVDQNPVYGAGETALGTDGSYKSHNGSLLMPGGMPPVKVWVPPGKGGGCAQGRNLANWTVNLGPVTPLNNSIAGKPNPQKNGLGYNPRCLTRDFGPDMLRMNSNYWNVSQLILNMTNIHTFHQQLESPARGVHGTGHTFIGGLNSDLFSSPGDPLFFLHHAQVDRIWSMWQSLDFKNRTNGLDGTMTAFNYPPSPVVKLEDEMYYSPIWPNVTIRNIMSPYKGKYCYMYE